MKFLFSVFGTILACPEPDSDSKSGSTDPLKPIVSNLIKNLRTVDNITLLVQVYMLSLSSQPVDHEEPGKQMVLGDQVSPAILEQSLNRVGIGLSYRPARLHRLAESIP
jgi:hypothetical protein